MRKRKRQGGEAEGSEEVTYLGVVPRVDDDADDGVSVPQHRPPQQHVAREDGDGLIGRASGGALDRALDRAS